MTARRTAPSAPALRSLASKVGAAPARAPMDAAAVCARLKSASAVLRDRGATGPERQDAGAVMAWLNHIPRPEDRRIVSAYAYGFAPEQIAEATGIIPEAVRARWKSAIVAALAR